MASKLVTFVGFVVTTANCSLRSHPVDSLPSNADILLHFPIRVQARNISGQDPEVSGVSHKTGTPHMATSLPRRSRTLPYLPPCTCVMGKASEFPRYPPCLSWFPSSTMRYSNRLKATDQNRLLFGSGGMSTAPCSASRPWPSEQRSTCGGSYAFKRC